MPKKAPFSIPLSTRDKTPSVADRSMASAVFFLSVLSLSILAWPTIGYSEKGSGLSQSDSSAAFARLQTFISSMRTMEAEFIQRVVNPSRGTPGESKGKFYASRPGKFRWDYQFPFEQTIVSDGKEIFFYEPDLKQVSVANWSNLNDSPASFFVSNEPLDAVFTWSVEPDPVFNYPMVRLKPKKPGDLQYIEVLLGPSNDKLIKLSILDSMGNLSHFHFYKSRLNSDIPMDRFQFQVPAGVDIVHTGPGKRQ